MKSRWFSRSANLLLAGVLREVYRLNLDQPNAPGVLQTAG
jgi:hypothetical protein